MRNRDRPIEDPRVVVLAIAFKRASARAPRHAYACAICAGSRRSTISDLRLEYECMQDLRNCIARAPDASLAQLVCTSRTRSACTASRQTRAVTIATNWKMAIGTTPRGIIVRAYAAFKSIYVTQNDSNFCEPLKYLHTAVCIRPG